MFARINEEVKLKPLGPTLMKLEAHRHALEVRRNNNHNPANTTTHTLF